MVGHHWLPRINQRTSGSMSVSSAKQEQDMSAACFCSGKKATCPLFCRTAALSALCMSLFVTCVALSVLYNGESDGKTERKSLLFGKQNISESQQSLTEANAELKKERDVLKKQNKLLNGTSSKLLSDNRVLSSERTELTENISNLTSANLQLTRELERLVRFTAEREEKELNMSETIRDLHASLNQREEEEQQASETVDLLRDELSQLQEKHQEVVEINDELGGEVKNLSESLAALMICEEHNARLQKRGAELQEQRQNLSSVLMKERQEAAEREESTRSERNHMTALQDAHRSLDLYCPVIDHKTKERNCKRCADSWRLFENKCYYFSSRSLTWGSSRAWCQTQGGDLLVVDSEPEQIFIFESSRSLQQSGSRLWLGMTDAEVEGEWSWVDGSSVTANRQYWLSRPGVGTEPDDWKQDDPAGEDCGHIDTGEDTLTSWMDGACENTYGWICEKDV